MQRRTLLKLGLGATALLAVVGGGANLMRPALIDGRMTPAARSVFHGVARAVLDRSLPAEPSRRDAALAAQLSRLDATLGGFPAAVQSELSQLLSLLASAPGRIALAGLHADWSVASVDEIQKSLQAMRTSSLTLRQQAYHALRDLTNAAYYADPDSWSLLGYYAPEPI